MTEWKITKGFKARPQASVSDAIMTGFPAGVLYNMDDEVVKAVGGNDAQYKETSRRAQEDRPLTYAGAQVVGAVASPVTWTIARAGGALGGVSGAMAPVGGFVNNAAQGAAAGFIEGYGRDGVMGGLEGAGKGALLSLPFTAASKFGGAAIRSLGNALGVNDNAAAQRAVAGAVNKSGANLQNIADNGLPEPMVLADTGTAARAQLGTATRYSVDARDAAENALGGRNVGAGARVQQAIQQNVGDAKGILNTTDDLISRRADAARANYGEALFKPDGSPRLVSTKGNSVFADKDLVAILEDVAVSHPFAKGNPANSMTVIDAAASELSKAARKASDPIQRATFRQKEMALRGVIRSQLGEGTPARQAYDNAVSQFAADTQNIMSLDTGRELYGQAGDVVQRELGRLQPAAKDYARQGYARAMSDDFGKGFSPARANQILGAGQTRATGLEAAMPDQNARQQLLSALQQEVGMNRTYSQALQGSQTAARMADDGVAGVTAQNIGNPFSGSGIASMVANKALPFVRGDLNENRAKIIAELLINPDTRGVAQTLLQRGESDATRKAIADILRTGGLSAGVQLEARESNR